MLKVLGVCLVVLSCTALGFERSLKLTRRLSGLRELQRMVLLIKGEISYRKEALPEALIRAAGRLTPPFSDFLRNVAERADAYDGILFADIFMQEAETAFGDSALTKEDKEELRQLGQYLGYLDISQQENAMALFQQELERKIQAVQAEIPVKKRHYQSLGVLGGIFLAITLI